MRVATMTKAGILEYTTDPLDNAALGERSRAPYDSDYCGHAQHDRSIDAWIKIRAVDRKGLPAHVRHRVKQRHGEHTLTRVVIEPNHHNPQRYGADAPSCNPVQRAVSL
jgi:hypothetical protein